MHNSIQPAAQEPSEATAKDGRGYFFAVDYRSWNAACELGLNAAVCYLLMARGTAEDNRTTRWSVHAVEGWSGISRPKARTAVDALIAHGLVENLNNSLTRPKRGLIPGHHLAHIAPQQPSLTKAQEKVLAHLPMERRPATAADTKTSLDSLIELGVVRFSGSHYVRVDTLSEEPDWIWLPNSLLDGAADETPPIEMIRMAQDLSVLRLLIDLYHAHSLSFYGGIPTSLIRLNYGAEQIAHQREYRIWKFEEDEAQIDRHAPFFRPFLSVAQGNLGLAEAAFWSAFRTLQKLGYVHFVGHLFEGAGADAEIIHPFVFCSDWKDVTEAERDLDYEAHKAAIALLPEFFRPKYLDEPIVPVRDHVRKPELRGIARLLYRPRTTVTAQWLALTNRWDWWTAHYKALIAKLPPVEPF